MCKHIAMLINDPTGKPASEFTAEQLSFIYLTLENQKAQFIYALEHGHYKGDEQKITREDRVFIYDELSKIESVLWELDEHGVQL